jgi:hypothetical protein
MHLNKGEVVSEIRGDDVWIGFKCTACGIISGWHKSYVQGRIK